jgi:methionine synthase II (cobalamin-independent)
MSWLGSYPRPEELEEAAVREREHELEATAEAERASEEAVPRRHRVRRIFSRLRRRR